MDLVHIFVEAPIEVLLDFPHTWGNFGPRLSFAFVPLKRYITCKVFKPSEDVCILLGYCDIHPV